jgi:septal ring factor EnvC (AmiA/AmiB activator)
MGQKIKIAIIVLASLLLISFIVILQLSMTKQALEGNLAKLSGENQTLLKQIQDISREKEQLADKVNLVSDKISSLTKEKEALEKNLHDLTVDLEKEKQGRLQSEERITPIQEENASLKSQVEQLTSRKDILVNQLTELQNKNKSLEDRFNEMDKQLKEKMVQVESIRKKLEQTKNSANAIIQNGDSVELSPIVIHPQGSLAMRPQMTAPVTEKGSLVGKVIAVNKENGFVVIDMGSEQGVSMGDTFKVYNNNKVLALLKVIQVRDAISACDIRNETGVIKEGDTVK